MAVKIKTQYDLHMELIATILNARNTLINNGFKGPFRAVLPSHFAAELGETFVSGCLVSQRILDCVDIEEILLKKNAVHIQVECNHAGTG